MLRLPRKAAGIIALEFNITRHDITRAYSHLGAGQDGHCCTAVVFIVLPGTICCSTGDTGVQSGLQWLL